MKRIAAAVSLALIMLPLLDCANRERQQELLERARRSNEEASGPQYSGPTIVDNASVRVTFEREEPINSIDTSFIVMVENTSPNNVSRIEGWAAIETTGQSPGQQLGFEIPLRLAPYEKREYTMRVTRAPMDADPRWERDDRVTGARFTVNRVEE